VRELHLSSWVRRTQKERSDKEVLYNIQPRVDRMDSVVETVKGTAYPLNSKRLRLQHIQHLARALDLPAAAPRSELVVMIGGKITELCGEEKTGSSNAYPD